MTGWITQVFGTTLWEAVAVVLALGYLLLAVRRSLWCWACAFVSTAIYLVLFADAQLYMQTVLQVFYLVMAVYGYREWTRGQTADHEVAIRSWPAQAHAFGALAVAALSAVSGWLLASYSDANAPYLDAFVTWGSVLTTWMVTRRILENWLYWVIVDAVAAYLYFQQDLIATGMLFLAYIGIVIAGYLRWRRDFRAQQEPVPVTA